MKSEYKRLDSEIISLQAQINMLPTGKLICSKNNNRYKWYQSDGHTKIYIPKKNSYLAQQLAHKKYLSLKIDELIKKKRAIKFYLDHYPSQIGKADDLLINNPEYKNLLSPFFIPLSEELHIWQNSSYDKNPKYPEHLLHKSSSGNLLRSKSESIIDMMLYNNKIPFLYECALQINECIIYPDFTIRHPKTGSFYYWEHFGLMDNPEYIKNTCNKIQLYASNGIIPTINLITTYETKDNPLDIDKVDKIISYYFL